jgi:polar amino acid transport system permease protein
VFRAGIQSISRGQFDAGRSLGLRPAQVMRYVVLPQAFRRMLPPLGNNAIALLKDTSLVSAIGLAEMAYAARTVAGAYARYWEPYLAISVVYWVMTLLLTTGLRRLEQHLHRSERA